MPWPAPFAAGHNWRAGHGKNCCDPRKVRCAVARGGCVTRRMSVVTGLRGRQKLGRGKELPGGKELLVIRDIASE